jgi:hypothetical protein
MELMEWKKEVDVQFYSKHQDDVEVSDVACDRHGVDTLILSELVKRLPI